MSRVIRGRARNEKNDEKIDEESKINKTLVEKVRVETPSINKTLIEKVRVETPRCKNCQNIRVGIRKF